MDGKNFTDAAPLMGVEVACKQSHVKALEQVATGSEDWAIIIEDDIFFLDNFVERLHVVIKELPEDWDALWLGGFEKIKGVKYSKNSDKIISQLGAYAYVVRKKFANTLIRALIHNRHLTTDGTYSGLQKRYNCFRSVLVGHHSGYSTIQRRVVDYKPLRLVS